MLRSIAIAAFVLATAGSGTAGTVKGTLAGQTQISFGCPGPVAAEGPSCNPWHPFAAAHFSVSRVGSAQATTVISDGAGRFSIRLVPGSYSVTPLPQPRTRGGATLHV